MVDDGETGTAERGGQRHAVEAQFARALPDLFQDGARGALLVVDAVFGGERSQLVLDEAAQPLDEGAGGVGALERRLRKPGERGGCIDGGLLQFTRRSRPRQ
jgi:hypothetical protein